MRRGIDDSQDSQDKFFTIFDEHFLAESPQSQYMAEVLCSVTTAPATGIF